MHSAAIALGLGLTAVVSAPPPTDWPAITQKPFADAAVPDIGLRPILERDGKPISTPDEWAGRRRRLELAWREKLGPLPAKPTSLDVRAEPAEAVDGYQRQLLSFVASDADRIRAYLLTPDMTKATPRLPAVVVFHSTTNDTIKQPTGLNGNPVSALGVHLVNRGYVVLCPECYIMKDGGPKKQAEAVGKAWPGLTGLGKMTFDASRCVDFLETLPAVDKGRIGCVGHSLGAKEVLYAMAFEPRYRAGASNEGGVGLRMSNWTDPWYLTDRMKEHIPAMENHQVLALCAPRPVLVLGGDSADGDASWPYIHAALPVYRLLGAGDRLGLVNHRGKHTFPQAARRTAYRWLDHWLNHTPASDEAGP